MSLIDLMRHGEPTGGSKFRGNAIDDPLSELGWQQMHAAVMPHDQWDVIVSSPLLRCRAFAEKLAGDKSLPLHIEDDFKEVGFGEWEGLTKEHLKAHRAEEYAAFYANPTINRPPGAEALEDFAERVSGALWRVIDHYPGQRMLIVAHAGVLRAVLSHVVQGVPSAMYNVKVEYAGRLRLSLSKDQLQLHSLSGTPLL